MKTPGILSLLTAMMLVSIGGEASAQTLLFYSKNDCRGDVAFRYQGRQQLTESCKDRLSTCRNDVARSMRVVKPGPIAVRVVVFDDPQAFGGSDDYTTLVFDGSNDFNTPPVNRCIGSFERTQHGPGFSQTYGWHNGLDGKISAITISMPAR